ncbi:Predicted arabinose efflux permease, MFS family [Paenibacillus algorifonticola]|uniref:Predicted arabinose efflux permease, MFS family n=1 Tax=Paenibacillus algorifonticola TaxID=684063 RepID=A0A1I2AF87_9BACL|nr:MFS transporter [Paenibacillus algorifonticola]SFE41653.1 Predicted arabinose efflux permease, MFS family [Paenibacillus algorifonticola]
MLQKDASSVTLPARSANYSVMTLILCWSGMAVMSSLYVTLPLLSLFAEHFSVTLTQAAAAGSIFSLGFAIGCLLYGAISEKYGRKKIIVIGLAALTVLSLAIGLVDQFPWLLVLRGLQGAAAATFSPVALAYAVEMFPIEKRVTTIGFISTGFLVAGIAGQVMSSLISDHFGWNAVFMLLAVVYTVTALLVQSLLPKGNAQQVHASVWAPLREMGTVWKQPYLVLSYIVAFVLLMSFVSMYTVLGSYLSGPAFGLGKQDLLYVRAIGVVGMLVSPFAGALAKRLGVRLVLRGGLMLAVAGLASLGFARSLPLLIVMSVIFVAGIALAVPSLVSLIGQLGGKSRGIAVSVYTFILFAGTSFGPMLSLFFMKISSYRITFFLLALVLGIGLLAACLIRREKREQ